VIRAVSAVVAILSVMAVISVTEVEHVEQVPDGRRINRHIGIVVIRDRVRQIVAAAAGQRLQLPVMLDNFTNEAWSL
jgi:hypothetical protein